MTEHEIRKHIAIKLRHYRWITGLTQMQLGELVGVKFQQIQKYESGANRIASCRLYKLAEALGVAVADFFPDTDQGVSRPLPDVTKGQGAMLHDFQAVETFRPGVAEAVRRLVGSLADQKREVGMGSGACGNCQ